jgi:hypothetical protein
MVLQPSDLPPGFAVDRAATGTVTNADLVRERGRTNAIKIHRWGRLTGYKAFFRQRDPAKGALPGVFGFGAGVVLFRTASGAHASLVDRSSGCTRKFTVIPLAGHQPVGPDTLVCTIGKELGRVHARVFLVQWRNGRAAGGVYVVAAEGAVTPLTALIGARKQNRRMAAQLRGG